jgi:large subunit ribosomal protein L6|tara:strand:+ start:688 stop:1230 length:543 start_codon:yes stop_codon:yes gene_type:complete
MKREIFNEIEIPAGVEIELVKNSVKVKSERRELEKKFNLNKLSIEKKDNKIIIGNKKSTKTEKRMTNTISSHIKNMIKGIQEEFEYDLKIASSHFPMTIELQEDKAIIKNFLGEKISREVKIPKGAEVKIDKDKITIKSIDREIAGQTAANFEQATKIRMKDRRIFQDGIFITSKAGRKM